MGSKGRAQREAADGGGQMTDQERRKHRRLEIRLPLECSNWGGQPEVRYRTVTLNVSTGGVYFETEATDVRHDGEVRADRTAWRRALPVSGTGDRIGPGRSGRPFSAQD